MAGVQVQNHFLNLDAAPTGPSAQGLGPRPCPAAAWVEAGRGGARRTGMAFAGRLVLAAAVVVSAWLGGGCRSPHGPGYESTAAVVFGGATPLEAARAVSDVFQSAGYKPLPVGETKDTRLEFERPGSGMANFLYGDFAANSVWSRVKIRISELEDGKLLVACDVFRVRDHGDVRFEREKKISPKKGRYRDLLEQVKTRAAPPAKQTR